MIVKCDICGKEFDTRKAMFAHRRWHDLPEYREFQEKFRKKVSRTLKGRKMSEKAKENLSKAKKGKPLTKKHRENIGKGLKGRIVTKETREKISKSRRGIKFTEEHLKHLSKAQKGKRRMNKNPNWKGDNIGYGGLHYRIRNQKPKPEKCEICGKKRDKYGNTELERSNISGNYEDDINDFQWVHRSCHRTYDYENKISIPESIGG